MNPKTSSKIAERGTGKLPPSLAHPSPKNKPGRLHRRVDTPFKHADANAKVHSDFVFPAKNSTLSWFALPLRTKISKLAGEAILDGISVSLPSQPDSVSRFFLSQIKDSVFVGIESERRIKFAEFSLEKELSLERAFADKLVEVKA